MGAEHPDTLRTLNNLALAYQDAGQLAQALPLLEQAAAAVEKRSYLREQAAIIIPDTVHAYEAAQKFDKAEAWQRKWLALLKQKAGAGSPDYAEELAALGYDLLRQKKYTDAEPILRECLKLREKLLEKKQAARWQVANAKSMLGEVLLGQNKPAEATPLLAAGYEGLKGDEKAIPEDSRRDCLTEAIQRLYPPRAGHEQARRREKMAGRVGNYAVPPPKEKETKGADVNAVPAGRIPLPPGSSPPGNTK